MTRIRAVGFDFDDTLIASEKEKVKMAEEIFYKKYGIKQGVKKAYKSLLGKMNREEKIKMLIRKFLKREPTNEEVKELSYSFGRGYEYKLSSCLLVQCTNLLKELKKQVSFMFLLSLENKKEVVNVAKHCGIAKYFDEILGGPKSKIENFKHIIKKHGVKPQETVYVGDSEGDIMTSKKLNFKAIGIQKDFSYRRLFKRLGADFTFPSLCVIPFKHITHGHLYSKK